MYYCCAVLFGTTDAFLFAYLLKSHGFQHSLEKPRSTFPASKVWRFARNASVQGRCFTTWGCEQTSVKNAVNYQPQVVEDTVTVEVGSSFPLFAVGIPGGAGVLPSTILMPIIFQTLSYKVLWVYLICTGVYLLF